MEVVITPIGRYLMVDRDSDISINDVFDHGDLNFIHSDSDNDRKCRIYVFVLARVSLVTFLGGNNSQVY